MEDNYPDASSCSNISFVAVKSSKALQETTHKTKNLTKIRNLCNPFTEQNRLIYTSPKKRPKQCCPPSLTSSSSTFPFYPPWLAFQLIKKLSITLRSLHPWVLLTSRPFSILQSPISRTQPRLDLLYSHLQLALPQQTWKPFSSALWGGRILSCLGEAFICSAHFASRRSSSRMVRSKVKFRLPKVAFQSLPLSLIFSCSISCMAWLVCIIQ